MRHCFRSPFALERRDRATAAVRRPGGGSMSKPERAAGPWSNGSSNARQNSSNARQMLVNSCHGPLRALCQMPSALGPLSNPLLPRPPHASQNPCKSAQKGISRGFGIVAEPLAVSIAARMRRGPSQQPLLVPPSSPRWAMLRGPLSSLSNPAHVSGPLSKPSKPSGPPGPPSNPSKARQNTDRARAHTTPPWRRQTPPARPARRQARPYCRGRSR